MLRGRGRIPVLEKLAVIVAVPAAYFLSLPETGGPLFMGAFNNLDGSLYAARAVSAAAGIAVFFMVAFYAFPARLDLRRALVFGAVSLAVVAVASLAETVLGLAVKWLFNLPFGPGAFSDKQLAYPAHATLDPAVWPRNALVAGLAFMYGVGRDWVIKSRTARRLETENMRAEIALLRGQINPHYFFNALNNIYAVTERNGDEEASRAILKLSDAMRYIIYDADTDAINVSREVEHIRNTIDVFRLRFAREESPDIRLRTEGDLDSILVAPALLVPFVENALKHGLDSSGQGRVEVDIRRDGPWLDVRVENTRRAGAETVKKPAGVGLANVRKRLELIYPRRHELSVEQTEESFRVHLRLKHGGDER
jgi:hypothetical protein